MPRQTGKSTMALMEFLREPETTLLVVYNLEAVRLSKEQRKLYEGNIVSHKTFCSDHFLRGNIQSFTKVIFDEYCFYKDLKKVREKLIYPNFMELQEMVLYSTPNRVYDERLFSAIKQIKSKEYPFTPVLDKNAFFGFDMEIVKELYYSFLTDPETKIIKPDFFRNKESEEGAINRYEESFDREWKAQYLF